MDLNGNFLNLRFFFNFFNQKKFNFQAKTLQESIQIKGQKLIECQTKIEQLESQLEELEDVLNKVKVESAEKLKLMEEDKLKIGNDFLGYFWRFLKLKKIFSKIVLLLLH